MATPDAMTGVSSSWSTQQASEPSTPIGNDCDTNGVSVRPMRLKVLYTFDGQNKDNCLARWPHVLQIQTVAMDETTSVGIIDLKTCIQAIIQCSPELIVQRGQDYTIYAYDFTEYDHPLVGQGMLSSVLATTPPTPGALSQQPVTGRVCKNIMGLFANGVKETLEVKLRLVPLPTMVQNEMMSMEKLKELNKNTPAGFDFSEWAAFLRSNPNLAQLAGQTPTPTNNYQRNGTSMEVVNQLLSPRVSEQSPDIQPMTAANSEPEDRTGGKINSKAQSPSRPSSRASAASAKRSRIRKAPTASGGGNTSGYEEGTDGETGPAPKKRAKITKAAWNSKSALGSGSESLRVAASTAGSLRMFRPIAMSPIPNAGNHLQEMPRAPTPVPNLPRAPASRDRPASQSGLRRDSNASSVGAPSRHISPAFPAPASARPEDQVRFSIESTNGSPDNNPSPGDTPPGISSSPPIIPASISARSSPQCPSSPVLPQMPNTDSGFMSGSLEDLFGENEGLICLSDDEDAQEQDQPAKKPKKQASRTTRPAPPRRQPETHHGFEIIETTPGPMEMLPTKIPIHKPFNQNPKSKSRSKSRANSMMSEDGQTLPLMANATRITNQSPLTQSDGGGFQDHTRFGSQGAPEGQMNYQPNINYNGQPLYDGQNLVYQESSASTPLQQQIPVAIPQPGIQPQPPIQQQYQSQYQPTPLQQQQHQAQPQPQPQIHLPIQPTSTLVRTASAGALTLPSVAQSDPAMPYTSLQRSQTWSDPSLPFKEFPGQGDSRWKKAMIKHRLEMAIARGEMPPFCSNCGAIETPTWRKAWFQELEGTPGYYEYSDEPGKVTAIVILTRDSEGKPTTYQLIKKALDLEGGESKSDYKELLLCNPCGIWMSKYKSQRPEDRWEINKPPIERKRSQAAERKRPSRAKGKKAQATAEPTSEPNFPHSDALIAQSEVAIPRFDGIAEYQPINQGSMVQQPLNKQRASSAQPIDMTNAAARRAIQSSPIRGGSKETPVELDDDNADPTRRILFPSPRKDTTSNPLAVVVTNVSELPADLFSSKDQASTSNKENSNAAGEDQMDTEFMNLFEEEMARPSTPVKESHVDPFKTPTRPTPNHRPVTRSISKSNKSSRSGKSTSRRHLGLPQPSPSRTPSTRRSPRFQPPPAFESPFTATLNQLISEASNHHTSPSRPRGDLQLDFGSDLPDLSDMAQHDPNLEFPMDFFSTDVPMPSSPPKLYPFYEESLPMNMDWNDFNEFDDNHMMPDAEKDIVIKEEPRDEDECEEDEVSMVEAQTA